MSSTGDYGGFQLTWVTGQEDRRRRRFSSKVKSGCETCKKRRIKCDEGKPACGNCARSGRRCEGYPTASLGSQWIVHDGQGRRSLADTRLSPQLQPRYGETGDRQYLDLFLQHTAGELVKFSNPYFWYTLVPQISWSHTSVRKAMAAVSLACYEFDQAGSSTTAVARQRIQSFNYYNAAIRSLTGPGGEQPSSDIVMLCCILFWLFENVKNRPCIAMTHLRAAILMLKERMPPSAHRIEPVSTHIESLLREGVKFAGTVLPSDKAIPTLPITINDFRVEIQKLQPSESPEDLRTCQLDFDRCQKALVMAENMRMSMTSPDPDMNLVRKLYSDWKDALERNTDNWAFEYTRAFRMHFAFHMSALDILESTLRGTGIEQYPDWRPRMRWILDEALYFAQLRQQQNKDHTIQPAIHLSLVTLLANVARQCLSREPEMAEEAVSLLEQYEWFEGIWNSKVAGELVRRMNGIDDEKKFYSPEDLGVFLDRAAGIKEHIPAEGGQGEIVIDASDDPE